MIIIADICGLLPDVTRVYVVGVLFGSHTFQLERNSKSSHCFSF